MPAGVQRMVNACGHPYLLAKKALEKYVKDFHRRFPDVRIVGHNELAAKACPSFDVQRWLKQIGITQ